MEKLKKYELCFEDLSLDFVINSILLKPLKMHLVSGYKNTE